MKETPDAVLYSLKASPDRIDEIAKTIWYIFAIGNASGAFTAINEMFCGKLPGTEHTFDALRTDEAYGHVMNIFNSLDYVVKQVGGPDEQGMYDYNIIIVSSSVPVHAVYDKRLENL